MIPEVVVTNLHRRYTGVSATVKSLVPHQRQQFGLAVWDWGRLGLGGDVDLWQLLRWGWTAPPTGRWRIWHARRDTELLTGLILRSLLRQPWKVVFTSAAPKRPGWWLRQLIQCCDAVIATSPGSAQFLNRFEAVIFHGVDCQAFKPPVKRQAVLAEVGLAGQQVIASFGRIRPSKGTDLFVEALIEVLPRHPGWVGVITGLCQRRDQVFLDGLLQRIAAAELDGRIYFVGDLEPSEIRRWYQRASICVAVSRREGFGLTPLEAMASGCVPVTSGAGAWPSIIRPEVGILVDPVNPSSLALALKGLLCSPGELETMSAAARCLMVKEFSIQRESELINALYAELAGIQEISCS